ncbi:translation protein SH3-like domain-containing protein [Mycena maculata]|uniref:Large ribosomal subunit protein uL2m n=1 Tax=Mycena maculata TaxID=230809 RepID=A0AAD7KE09_9AGAR|nr:translation protein SH3-like domain-containing protein [Mycena maculata]
MLAALRALRRGAEKLTRAPGVPQVRSYAESKATLRKLAKKRELDEVMSRTQAVFKTYKPVSPGIRHLRRPLNPHIWEGRPVVQLTIAKRKTGGRNARGRITVRHRGGGHRQRIRTLDFKREEPGVHDVVRIEYDPGRSAHIALLKNRDPNAQGMKKWSYIVAPEGIRAGDSVQSFRQGIPEGFIPGLDVSRLNGTVGALEADEVVDESVMSRTAEEIQQELEQSSSQSLALGLLRTLTLKPGNVLQLRLIPIGTVVHNIALAPSGPGVLVRSAGSSAQVVGHEASRYTHVRLQSGEVRKVLQDCCATIGRVSNPLWKNRNLGKAGRARWLGRRPSVRGVAMNANDHPHGGGRGKSKSNKHPVSIWGWGAKGTRTRKPGPKGPKNSNKMVVRERPRGHSKRSN